MTLRHSSSPSGSGRHLLVPSTALSTSSFQQSTPSSSSSLWVITQSGVLAVVLLLMMSCSASLSKSHVVLPVLYGDDSVSLFSFRLLAVVVLLEILVNWLCVRFVTSSYRPEVDRTFRDRRRPVKNGDVISEYQHVDDDGDDDDNGFEIDLAQLRVAKPEVGGNGVSPTTLNGISGSVYSLPVSGMRSLGASGGVDWAWRRGDTIYVVSGHQGDDGARVFNPPVARWNGGPRGAGCRKVMYPYWSSKPCSVCRHRRPPRAHHCRHCGSCVLKRDHHCLLVGRCVGLRNQRHFIVFVFWSTVALALSFSHGIVYAFTTFVPQNSVWDLLLPVTAIRVLSGAVSLLDGAMVLIFYSLGWFLVASVRFSVEQWRVVRLGVTSFELDQHIKVTRRLSRPRVLITSAFHSIGVFRHVRVLSCSQNEQMTE